MKVFAKSVHAMYDTPDESRSLFDTQLDAEAEPTRRLPGPYMINAVFTMPALFAKIDKHDGQYLLLFDEMTLLFKNIDKDSKDSPMRQIFLSLANGDSITRSTNTAGEEFIWSTNVNFSGEYMHVGYIQAPLTYYLPIYPQLTAALCYCQQE